MHTKQEKATQETTNQSKRGVTIALLRMLMAGEIYEDIFHLFNSGRFTMEFRQDKTILSVQSGSKEAKRLNGSELTDMEVKQIDELYYHICNFGNTAVLDFERRLAPGPNKKPISKLYMLF